MTDHRQLIPFIKAKEGGYVNDPLDKGGATNKGVTMATYTDYCRKKGKTPTIDGLKTISDIEWEEIFKNEYWDRWKADQIKDQNIANILVDWLWCSGNYGIKIPQKVVGVTADGVVGAVTIAKINSYDPQELFEMLKKERLAYIDRIVLANPSQRRFEKGWKNRINALNFK